MNNLWYLWDSGRHFVEDDETKETMIEDQKLEQDVRHDERALNIVMNLQTLIHL